MNLTLLLCSMFTLGFGTGVLLVICLHHFTYRRKGQYERHT